jgi:UDP-GlcNAc:undecaprenyl-phosphate/decaprenyl-phosphate GlcNAc-1-phosphate transferase
LPLLDLTLAVLRRIRAGKSPFAADRKHIHHKLQDFGHSHVGSVMVFYLWTAVISFSALGLLFIPAELVLLSAIIVALPIMTYTVWPVIDRRRKRAKSK